MNNKISPIFYMGNKKRLIEKGLIDLFPKEIDCFYDLFGGSGVVSLNVNSNKYILNELDTNIFNLYNTLKDNNPNDIIAHIENMIKEYDLPQKSTNSVNTSTEEREYYKENYMRFRDNYNKNKNPFDLFVLMNYCLSQTMRFNLKGQFNMPFGNNRFIKEKHSQYYIDFNLKVNEPNFKLHNKSYLEFSLDNFEPNDFIYLDPPYLNSLATYNENGKWSKEKQDELLAFCDKLTNLNIKWAMSNALENKGNRNIELEKWCDDNNYNIYTFDNFSYHSYGKGDANTSEILITNY